MIMSPFNWYMRNSARNPKYHKSATLLQDGTFQWNYYSRVSHGTIMSLDYFEIFSTYNFLIII